MRFALAPHLLLIRGLYVQMLTIQFLGVISNRDGLDK